MNYNKKEIILQIAILLLLLLTPVFMYLQYIERGYFAIGGECIAWMIPLVIYMEVKYEI